MFQLFLYMFGPKTEPFDFNSMDREKGHFYKYKFLNLPNVIL